MGSNRMRRHEIADRIRRANQEQVARHRGDHVATTFTIGQERITATHDLGNEMERAEYQAGIVALGRFVDQPVTMTSQFHSHSTDLGVAECDCHVEHPPTVWRNALARVEFAALANGSSGVCC